MKVFLVHFGGYALGGTMIVVDQTKEAAFHQAKEKINAMGLTEANKENWFSINNPECIEEINTTTKNILVASDGNY